MKPKTEIKLKLKCIICGSDLKFVHNPKSPEGEFKVKNCENCSINMIKKISKNAIECLNNCFNNALNSSKEDNLFF